MSDYMSKEMENDQKTRVMPSVAGAESPAAPVRRRRSDRYRSGEQQEAPQTPAPRPLLELGEAPNRPQARYVPTAGQQGSVPASGVPRPAALTRNQEQGRLRPLRPATPACGAPSPRPGIRSGSRWACLRACLRRISSAHS